MLPDRAGQAKRAAPPQAGRRRQGLKPEWGETGYRARFTKARSWPWPGDAMKEKPTFRRGLTGASKQIGPANLNGAHNPEKLLRPDIGIRT